MKEGAVRFTNILGYFSETVSYLFVPDGKLLCMTC